MATPPFLPDETKPGASDLVSLFPNVEQTFRDVIEDWILWEHNTGGTHKQVTLDDISPPTIPADKVGIWHESGVMKTRFAAGTVYDVLTSNTGLKLSGGTMTGKITLDGVPTSDLHASTKKYVDDEDVLKAPLASPAFTGNPTAPTQTEGNDSTRLASTAFVTVAVEGSGFAGALFHVRDQKSNGVDGGTFTSGAWRTRALNTVLTNEIAGVTLVSNQIVGVPAGDYYIEASAPGSNVIFNKVKLRNITDSSDILIGTGEDADLGGSQVRSFVSGRFTLAAPKTLELQHRCSTTKSTTGFGRANSFSVIEVYTDVKIWKVG